MGNTPSPNLSDLNTMPLQLKPRLTSPLPEFTFAPPSPTSSDASPSSPPRPPADLLPERDMHMFGTYPLKGEGEMGRGLVRCKRCGKVVLEWASMEHKREWWGIYALGWKFTKGLVGICAHVLDGSPLVTKKTTKVPNKDELGKKRRASEGEFYTSSQSSSFSLSLLLYI